MSLNKDMAKYMVSQSGIKVPKGYLVRQVSDIELALRFLKKKTIHCLSSQTLKGTLMESIKIR